LSVISVNGSACATRSGIITQVGCASASGKEAKGCFSRKRITRSDGAAISAVRAISAVP